MATDSPPALQEATINSTSVWQHDLESLFHLAKDRFPDVVWTLSAEDDDHPATEEVWGHKAIVYARAPPSFQNRYFSFRPNASSPLPYSSSPNGGYPTASALSLSLGLETPGVPRSPSPYRTGSPAPSVAPGTVLRLSTSINPTLFSNELEYLYTGKGMGEAFEFLFDSAESRDEGDAEELRMDKLRKDLVFMWRSRLYSDVRLALTGTFSTSHHEDSTAVFSSHRFILISRSNYFHNALVSWPSAPKQRPGEPLTLQLPSPPFTPASLHFTLGFIYTGTLVFSHRSYDLDTGLQIMRASIYLSIQTLYDEIQARIVQEMMHGLFHAFLEFSEYERLTGSKWGTGGCRCRQCARRAPRILEFAMADDVKNPHLERGARRALVGLFGEGWCTTEFASLPQRTRDVALKGVGKRTTPQNVFALLFAAEHALIKLNPVIDSWADTVRDMIFAARKGIDDCLAGKPEECFSQQDWMEMMENDGVRFEDGERIDWIMSAIKRGVNDKNAALLYQTLVSAVLLHLHPTEQDQVMLSETSHIRIQVDDTRMDVLRYIKKRWLTIRQDGGFDQLEGWAVKEIADELDVAVDDLNAPAQRHTVYRNSLRPKLDQESDTGSMHSMRVSVLNKATTPKRGTASTLREPISSGASVRSMARSTVSKASVDVNSTIRRKVSDPRPDSKLTPPTENVLSVSPPQSDSGDLDDQPSEQSTTPSTPLPKTLVRPLSAASRRSILFRTTTSDLKPKSSVSSIRTRTSTVASTRSSAGPSNLRPVRPTSSLSSATSDGSGTFKTANTAISRSRRTSNASTISVKTTASTTTSPRSRRTSVASTVSTISTTPSKAVRRPPVPSIDPAKLSPSSARRPPSIAPSVRSVSSTRSTSVRSTATVLTVASRKTATTPRKPATTAQERKTPLATVRNNAQRPVSSASSIRSVASKGKGKATTPVVPEHKKTDSTKSTGSTMTLKRKGSTDTITPTVTSSAGRSNEEPSDTSVTSPQPANGPLSTVPKGDTLGIGIPCIISSKRKRFKAYARYIGEVEGEFGPWVGVEVPFGENWGDEVEPLDGEGRQWHDGTWGGVRYFEISNGTNGSEWDYGDDRAARRRRTEGLSSSGGFGTVKDKGLLKREGDQLSVDRAKRFRSASPAASDLSTAEARGLFVRPQQVLYVVDAVG
ncbi:hypothetical protein EYR40_010616 [Pleurotus pulmonarius]|nr:hypothetical protein EYR40_010616 [Pleurotus pulmonarius]